MSFPRLSKDLRKTLNVLTDQLNAKIRSVVERVDLYYPNKYIRFYDIDPQFEGHQFCDVDEQGRERPDPDWKKEAWFLTLSGSDMRPDSTVVPVDNNNHRESVDLRTLDVSACLEPHEHADNYMFTCLFAQQIQEHPGFKFVAKGEGADLIVPLWEPPKAFHPKTIAHSVSYLALGEDVHALLIIYSENR
jgi:hypothetical protein